jgi:PKD repeat protein
MRTFLNASLILLSLNLPGQNEYTKWFFARHAGLDFATSPPAVITHTTLHTFEGSSCISDQNGNLLFYTDGITVWNAQKQVMANGSGLSGNMSTVQSALIVKQPGQTHLYFVFTLDCQGGANGLRYSMVDMMLSSGLGSVTVKNTSLTTPCSEHLSGTYHCNGTDLWIMAHGLNSNNFLAYLVTAAGVSATPVVSATGGLPATLGQGTLKFSPNGNKLAVTHYNTNPVRIELFDFDRSTGIVSNPLTLLTATTALYGCEFSPNGSKLYTAHIQGGTVYQWDLCGGTNSSVMSSMQVVSQSTTGGLSQLQAAPDGKIYISRNANTYTFTTIDNPNAAGTTCNVNTNGLAITSGTLGFGLPNFIGDAFRQVLPFTHTLHPQISCNTATFTAPITTTACSNVQPVPNGYLWNFGDPASGLSNTSTLINPIHQFSSPGIYPVKLVTYYPCRTDTAYGKVHTAISSVSVSASPDTTCANNQVLLSGTATGVSQQVQYQWNGIPTQTLLAARNAGHYVFTLTVSDANNCSLSNTIAVYYMPRAQVTVASATVCKGSSVTLTAAGAQSYTWHPFNVTGPVFTITPNGTVNLTLTGVSTGSCAGTQTASVFVSGCSELPERHILESSCVLFPNPIDDLLRIRCNKAEVARLYDHLGHLVSETNVPAGEAVLDTAALPPGVYHMILGEAFYRVVKQ